MLHLLQRFSGCAGAGCVRRNVSLDLVNILMR